MDMSVDVLIAELNRSAEKPAKHTVLFQLSLSPSALLALKYSVFVGVLWLFFHTLLSVERESSTNKKCVSLVSLLQSFPSFMLIFPKIFWCSEHSHNIIESKRDSEWFSIAQSISNYGREQNQVTCSNQTYGSHTVKERCLETQGFRGNNTSLNDDGREISFIQLRHQKRF